MKKLKVVLIGAGSRGIIYSDIMAEMRDKFEIVAVADPKDSRRNYVKNLFNIPNERCFLDGMDLLKLGKIADIAIISTMDRNHLEPAMKAIDLKYDILLEKPIAPTAQECVQITQHAKKNGVRIVICTVLRYTPVFNKLKELIETGRIGKVMSINHEECVGNVHQSHSFVRGNWGNVNRSSVMLLQKSCHDIDIIQWLINKKCKSVHSFGALSYFTRENAPKNSPDYCVHGCPVSESCPYNAIKLYFDDKDNEWFRTTCTGMHNPSDDDVMRAITETQYGKCVFKCDNDVVDHQTVNLLFEDDITVTFTMNAFNKGGRFIHIMGTKGQIHAAIDGDNPIRIYDFETQAEEEIPYSGVDGIAGGHGGGDKGIVNDLYYYITNTYDGSSVPTIEESCYNHLVVFAADKSRETNTVINVEEFIKTLTK